MILLDKAIAAGGGILDFNLKNILIASGCNQDLIKADLACVVSLATSLFGYLLNFIVLIAVLSVLYASYIYVTAYGDDAKAEKGKKLLLWTIIGVFLASIIKGVFDYLQKTVG